MIAAKKQQQQKTKNILQGSSHNLVVVTWDTQVCYVD